MSGWKWREKNGAEAGLLYEPGNWGDLLKDAWVLAAARWLLAARDGVQYFDPFAGAPTYPLGKHAAARTASAGGDLAATVAPYLQRLEWPSAAMLVATVLDGHAHDRLTVFDADAKRYGQWLERGRFQVCKGSDGYQALRDLAAGDEPQGRLILVDPYDFLADWRAEFDAVLEASERNTVLLYLYNRSARGPEQLREYRDFRNALEDARAHLSGLLGRVPADAFLPRAHHEMLFLPGPHVREHADFERLMRTLAEEARRVAAAVRRGETVERL